jgi:hypothetical protein
MSLNVYGLILWWKNFVKFVVGIVRCVRTACSQLLTSVEQVIILLTWRGVKQSRNKLYQQVWYRL